MKTITNKRYLTCLLSVIALLITAIVVSVFSYLMFTGAHTINARQLRIDTSEVFYELGQNGGNTSPYIDDFCERNDMLLLMVGLDQKIQFTAGENPNIASSFTLGNTYELRTTTGTTTEVTSSGLLFSSSPIVASDRQIGTAILYTDASKYSGLSAGALALCIVLWFVWFLLMFALWLTYHHLCHYIIKPIQTLHSEIEMILHNEIDHPLRYDYDDEIGLLCRDTELLRQELFSSEKRSTELRAKEKTLLACISHDLKTPLFAISSYTEGIRDGIVETDEERANYCNIILNRIQVMGKLIDDIMEHSKAEMQELSIELQPYYAPDWFTQVLASIRSDLANHGEKLIVSSIPQCSILIDSARMEQVLYNLVSNAMKYSDYQTDITFDFSIQQRQGADVLQINVTDNGKGISASDLPFIFEKFYRGEKARSADIPGSGLGLNISKYIIEHHGGSIECESIVGQGSTFSFCLPL